MKFFLDTANLDEILKAGSMDIVERGEMAGETPGDISETAGMHKGGH